MNFVLAFVYLLLHLHKAGQERGMRNFLFMLIFPIVGFMFLFMAKLADLLFQRLRETGISVSELSFSKERMKLPADIDVEEELNKVPLEEVMIVADKNTRRSSLISVLKRDTRKDMMGAAQEFRGK